MPASQIHLLPLHSPDLARAPPSCCRRLSRCPLLPSPAPFCAGAIFHAHASCGTGQSFQDLEIKPAAAATWQKQRPPRVGCRELAASHALPHLPPPPLCPLFGAREHQEIAVSPQLDCIAITFFVVLPSGAPASDRCCDGVRGGLHCTAVRR